MIRKKSNFQISAAAIFIFGSFFLSNAHGQPQAVVREYISALKNGEWDKAQSFWLPPEIERANRLGIKFSDIEVKYDCTSPYVNDRQKLKIDQCVEMVKADLIDSTSARVDVSIRRPLYKQTDQIYYLVKTGETWQICSPMLVLARNWQNKQTKYFSIIYSDSSLLNDYAISEMDGFIDTLADLLQIPADRMKHLEQTKIDYYLCTAPQMKSLTGFEAHGMTSFPFDAIITRHLPHTHEIVHLMTNYALQELPLYTVPVAQEGLACCLGGRWGKTPAIINYWGNVSVALGMTDLDDVITTAGFIGCPGGADAAYAISSLFAQSSIENFGAVKFLEFYGKLSGNLPAVESLSVENIKSLAVETFGKSWTEIQAHFDDTVKKYHYCGIVPGKLESGAPLAEASADQAELSVLGDDKSYYFTISMHGDFQGGLLTFSEHNRAANTDYVSWQFEEQNPGIDYNGAILGLKFNKDEAGLYDYRTNMLIAKYVYGFTPEDDYYDPDSKQITFAIDKNLLGRNIEDYRLSLY